MIMQCNGSELSEKGGKGPPQCRSHEHDAE